MDFYSKMIKLCNEKGVSRSKMADSIGISRSTPKDWESGKSKPRPDTIKRISDYFGVPVSYFSESGHNIDAQILTGNFDIMGLNRIPSTTINGSEYGLTDQETELLNLFKKLSVMNRAKLLVYAGELQNK